eukprot:TRINITY_DN11875_c0_g1_i1.p1 TRINITY_DN11875_c0_g1~~TRINITY_DN11875_c0_g1_i1.p1  ORF type:complete len:389 (+),score=109.55 TRINITY_DN11875_c0_g1_i1:55-1167(+)
MDCIFNIFRTNKTILERKFKGKSAMITGAAAGMGREMAILMARSGVKDITICDMNAEGLADTVTLCNMETTKIDGFKITTRIVDVTKEEQLKEWAEEYKVNHNRTDLHFMVCNAGIAGGKGFLTTSKELWDKVFNVDFHGVVNTVRQWIPLVLNVPATEEAGIINLSSLNGFLSCISLTEPNHPYIAAKFAVRGFTESLMVELATSNPNIVVTCVHPGHVGTDILSSSTIADRIDPNSDAAKQNRSRVCALLRVAGMKFDETTTDAELRVLAGKLFKERAPVTAPEAANIILTGVAKNSTRILVGADAVFFDFWTRLCPRLVYTKPFWVLLVLPMMASRHVFVYACYRKPIVGLAAFALAAAMAYAKFLM